MKKGAAITVISILAVLAIALGVLYYLSNTDGVQNTYEKALASMQKGEFAKAADELSGISFYEDSVQLTQYCRAHAYASEGRYGEAFSLLNGLGNYRDSAQWYAYYNAREMEEISAEPAGRAYAAKMYSAELLREFRDAAARAESIRSDIYLKGQEAEEAGDWNTASEAYGALDNYLDSSTRYLYAAGRVYEASGENTPVSYINAIRNYESSGQYADSAERAENCLNAVYAKAEQMIASGDFDGAESLYSELGDRCDESKKATLSKARKEAREEARRQRLAEAEKLAADGSFDEAEKIYLDLGETTLATDVLYRKADYFVQEGKIREASRIYLNIGNYLDSREKHFGLGVEQMEPDPTTASAILLEDVEYRDAKEKLYEIADKASAEKNYPLSISIFNELGSVKDCRLRMTNDMYLYGRQLLEGGQNEEAVAIFDTISGIGSADLYSDMARYAAAEKLQEDGSLEEASSAFALIGDYRDAKERSLECSYLYGIEEKKAGSYENAIAVFSSLKDYKDSAEEGKECKYLLAVRYEGTKKWSSAISCYEELGEYSDSAARCKACYNSLGEEQLSNGDANGAYQSFAKGEDEDGQMRASYAVAEDKVADFKLEDALSWYEKAAALPETEARTAMIAEKLLHMEEDELSEKYASVVTGSEKGQEILYALAIRSLERQDEDAAMRQLQKAGDRADASERFTQMLAARVEALVANEEYEKAADLCASYGDQEQADALLKQKAEKEEEERKKTAEENRKKHQAKIDEANQLLENKEYEAAAAIFREIGETQLADDALALKAAAEEEKRAAEEEEKRRKYQAREEEGNTLLAAGDFDGALAVYRELGNREMISETIYRKAAALGQPGLYLEIIDYKDSREKHYLAGKELLDSDPENAYRILAEDIGYQDAQSVLYTLADRESSSGNYSLSSAIFTTLGQQPLDPADPRPDCRMRSIQDMYQYGLDLQNQGEWELAASIFDSLNGLSQAELHSNEAYYAIAAEMENREKYTQAALAFEALGDYADAAERAKKNRYDAARKQMEAANYESAVKMFIVLGDYSDSVKMANECRYRQALNLMENGDYTSALNLFRAIGQYSDSADRMNECTYLIAGGLYEQGEYEKAMEQYKEIRAYRDSADRIKACYEELGNRETAKAEEWLRQDEKAQAAISYETAYGYYTQAGSTENSNSAAMMAGACYQSANNLSTAIKWYQKAGETGESHLMSIVQYAITTEQFDAAESILIDIDSEKSREMLYKFAEKKLSENDPEAALRLFSEAGDYADASKRHDEIIYQQAESLEKNKEYTAAAELFGTIYGHKDAAERKNSALYKYAETLVEQKDYKEAQKIYISLGEYADAADKANEISNLAIKVGDIVTFGHYEQDNNTANGPEPIEWIVLDVQDEKAMLLSKYGLDAKPYNTKCTDTTWEKCSLRNWLNRKFLQSAFSKEEQAAILTTTVNNDDSQGYREWNTDGGRNTQDQIFLLSYAEANRYLKVTYDDGDNTKARVAPTEYAIAQGASANSNYETTERELVGLWWLRSPGAIQQNAAIVYEDGSLYGHTVNYDYVVVRPALWLDLGSGIY